MEETQQPIPENEFLLMSPYYKNRRSEIIKMYVNALASNDKRMFDDLLFRYHPKYRMGSPHFMALLNSEEGQRILAQLEQEY